MADLIAEIGEEILRRVSEPVKDIQSPETRKTAQTLFSNLSGLGLAAPQIRKSLRMFVLCSRPTPAYPDALHMAPTLVINPEILKRSAELDKGWEGCMSIPGFRGLVPRSCNILVRFVSSEGQMQETALSGRPGSFNTNTTTLRASSIWTEWKAHRTSSAKTCTSGWSRKMICSA